MNRLFAESTTGIAFVLTLSKRQCNTLLRLIQSERMYGKPVKLGEVGYHRAYPDEDDPANMTIVGVDNLKPLQVKGLVFWHTDHQGHSHGFGGLTRAGELVACMLEEAGMTIENTNTVSILKRLDRIAARSA